MKSLCTLLAIACILAAPSPRRDRQNCPAPPACMHVCPFATCPYTGSTTFSSDCEEGSDCYYLDLLHWQHPTFTYDQLDSLLFTTTTP